MGSLGISKERPKYAKTAKHNLRMASFGFIVPPEVLGSPLNLGPPKAPGPSLIYLVGLIAISDPHINICVGSPNTCIAFKQFNLLPPNTLF